MIHRRATGRFRDQICSTAIIYLHVQDRASNDRNMWRAVGKIMMWRCIHDGESRVVFSLKKVVCALVSANFAAARAVRVESFHCKGGGRAAKRVIFNVISGLVFWPCCKFSAGVYPLSCSRPAVEPLCVHALYIHFTRQSRDRESFSMILCTVLADAISSCQRCRCGHLSHTHMIMIS